MAVAAFRGLAPMHETGKPLPWRSQLQPFYQNGISFRRGQVIMISGFPGSMKTTLASWVANLWNLPTLYVQADTSQFDTLTRLGAMRSGTTVREVAKMFDEDLPGTAYIESQLEESRIQYVFDDSPSLYDIEEELFAWLEVYDSFPEVLVVDNLVDLNLEGLGEGKYDAWIEAIKVFKGWAREYDITPVILHHARELGNLAWPAARKDIAGKVSQTAELSFTVAMEDNTFRLATVKNRQGVASPSADKGLEFKAYPERMDFQYIGTYDRSRED